MNFLLLFLLAAGVNIVLGWHDWPAVFAGSLNDPDSYMRLVRLEQGIHAGHLVVNVARDDGGAGVYIEWSRLLDIILWVMAAPLAVLVGWHRAVYAAGVALGPLGVGLLGLVLAWSAEPLAARRYLWTASLAAALLPGFTIAAMPGVVHYHILLLVLIALCGGCMVRAWRNDRWMGFLGGLAGGFAIWLTPETMPFILAAFAVLLLRWWRMDNGLVLMATAAGCFDVLGFGFFVDPPGGAGYIVPAVDRLSYVYVAMALLLLGGTVLLQRLTAKLRHWRGPAGVALLGAIMALWIALFPRVAMGPYGILPAAEAQAFFGAISEQQPVRGAALIMFLLPGACAVVYALWRAWGREKIDFDAMAAPSLFGAPPKLRAVWLYIAACGVVCLALGAKTLLFVGFPTLLGAALLPVALSEMSSALAGQPWLARMLRGACIALVLGVPLVLAMSVPMQSYAAVALRPVAATARAFPSCDLREVAPLLVPAAGQIVLAGPEETPELLYRSKILTVGSLYHHGIAAYLRDRAAWRVTPGTAVPPEVTATGAEWLLFCPRPGRYALVADLPAATLWDVLEAGAPPPWLTPAGRNAQGWQLYKITP